MRSDGRRRWPAAALGAFALAVIVSFQGTGAVATPAAQTAGSGLHAPLDEILDVYVRDGFVYYLALRQERARFDRYVESLDTSPERYEAWSRAEQAAFWVNAYNAFVLRTVIDRYPIRGKAPEYPANSIRQIPGAFEGIRHRAAGRLLTLDEIEREVLPQFQDPRLFLALGRGAVGGGRLRSEAFTGDRLEAQLHDVVAECPKRVECIAIDKTGGRVSVSPIFGWRETEFVEAYAGQAPPVFASRSPIERSVLSLVEPYLYPSEEAFLRRNAFEVAYAAFDWRLNDLTGGRP